MTREEMILVFGEMRKTYPVYYRQLTRQEAENMVSLWAELFIDYPVDLIMAAAKQFMLNDTKGFPPVPGQLMAIINATLKPASDIPSEAEAWKQIKRAVSDGAYNAGKEFDKLHPILKRLVGGPDTIYRWAMMEEEVLDMNIRPMICRSYNQYAEMERADKLLPPSMQANVYALRDAARPALVEPERQKIEAPEPISKEPTGADNPGFLKFMAKLRELSEQTSMDEPPRDIRDDDADRRAWTEAQAREMGASI